MTTLQARHDAWQSGDNYDGYMGRWSAQIAPMFLGFLKPELNARWFELGCGTGALTQFIVQDWHPSAVVAADPSAGFIEAARKRMPQEIVDFRVSGAGDLGMFEPETFDYAVSGLVLNFVPEPAQALEGLARLVRPGGTVAFYVWDYPGGGVEFMRRFWEAAVALDSSAADLPESKRFPFCNPVALGELVKLAGMPPPRIAALETVSRFTDFQDFWGPFTMGTGPAPGYCASLPPEHREALEMRLKEGLPFLPDGSLTLRLRAWALTTTRI
ncbi:class I SAM-dependent methyltransferase [Roseivivax sp. CAU 1761]